MSLAGKLSHYFPDAQWSLNGEDYAGLDWHGANKPTEQAIAALAWPPDASTDPTDYPLSWAQFHAMVDHLGKDAEIRAAVAQIESAIQRAFALKRYEGASAYRFDDPLLQQMRGAIGMSVEALSAAWLQAKDLRSS